MKIFFVCLFMFFSRLLPAQTNAITGVIIDADSKEPLGSCNVFISNTSKGKITDTAGKFTLYDLPEGKSFDLVVSSVGYETFTYNFSSKQLPLNLRISLNKKIVEMENVTIIPAEVNGWEKWGSLFIKSFLGESENASACNIENTGIIKFRRYKKEDLLEASADGILIIKNHRLGYIIKYQLEKFVYDFKNQSMTYLGYPLFEEMEYPVPSKFAGRRLKAYKGSLMHFVRSLYANRLAEEGFEARRMERTTAFDTIKNDGEFGHMVLTDSTGKRSTPPYIVKKVLRENVGAAVLTSDSVLFKSADSIKDILAFNNYLWIRYLREPEPAAYVEGSFPIRKPQHYQLTKLIMLNEEKSIIIQPNGYYYPALDLFVEGYLGWEKIGDLLPLDYPAP